MLNFRPISNVWANAAEYLVRPPVGYQLPWWSTFNELLGGLRLHEITLLCAPTGAGKTQWLASIAAQLLSLKVPTYVAPVENGDADFLIRIIENLDQKTLNDGNAKTVELVQKLDSRYSDIISRFPMYISTHENRVEIEEMVATLRFMSETHGVKVALLDNLNFFLKITSTQMQLAEMDSAIHEFVMLAKNIPMHIFLIVHPRKTDYGRVESEFDIKGSATAVQEASNVILFNRAKPEDIESKKRTWSERELTFRKIRKRGINVGKRMWFDFNNGRYEEVME